MAMAGAIDALDTLGTAHVGKERSHGAGAGAGPGPGPGTGAGPLAGGGGPLPTAKSGRARRASIDTYSLGLARSRGERSAGGVLGEKRQQAWPTTSTLRTMLRACVVQIPVWLHPHIPPCCMLAL